MSNSLQTHGLSMEFSRQEHWSGLPFLSPGDRPDSGIKPGPPAMQADSLPSELPGKPINKCINSFSSDNKYYESKGNRGGGRMRMGPVTLYNIVREKRK